MDVDIFQLAAMQQQVWPVRRKLSVQHVDGNLNLTDALFTAFHVSFFALWPSTFPSRLALWAPRLWRFTAHNVDPGALQGGIVETITIDKYADSRTTSIAARFRDRIGWRNKVSLSDRVEDIQFVPLLFPTWMWLAGPQHIGKWVRRKAQQRRVAQSGAQALVQTQVIATTSPPFGDVRYTGGRIVIT